MLEIALRLLLALYLIAGGAVLAYFISGRLLKHAPAHLRFCGMVIAGMGLATLGFHALVPLRWFRLPIAALALLGLLALAFGSSSRRAQLQRLFARDRRWLRQVCRLLRTAANGRWGLAFFVCALPVLLRPLALPPTRAWH